MALENLGAALATRTESGVSEIAGLPERAEIPKEISGLPERAETPKEISGLPDKAEVPGEAKEAEGIPEAADVRDADLEKVSDTLSSPEGIEGLMERHPEKAAWKDGLKSIEVLNDPDATDAERRSAEAKLSPMKGDMLETAVKDALSDAGLTVERKQRVVDGLDGGTRPDVIAKNDTDRPIEMFGITVKPGESLSIECKCGSAAYLNAELRNHIPNQLSGQIGHRALLTTADIRQADTALARDTCEKYGASLIVVDIKAATVEKAIKEVSAS